MATLNFGGPLLMKKNLSDEHRKLKKTRQRGSLTPSHLASIHYLKLLELELQHVQQALQSAWKQIDSSRDFMKCVVHMDSAQQRLHRAIKKLKVK